MKGCKSMGLRIINIRKSYFSDDFCLSCQTSNEVFFCMVSDHTEIKLCLNCIFDDEIRQNTLNKHFDNETVSIESPKHH